MKNLGFATLLVIFAILASSNAWAFAPDETVTVPALREEGIVDVIRRVHPCASAAGDTSVQKIIADNPERVNNEGRYVVATKTVKMPKAFAEACPTVAAPLAVIRSPDGLAEQRVQPKPEPRIEPKIAKTEEHKDESASEDSRTENEFKIGPSLEYARLIGSDFSGNRIALNSRAEYGGFVEFERASHGHSIGIDYHYIKTALKDPNDRDLGESSKSIHSAEATAGLRIGEETWLKGAFGAEQLDHVSFPDATSVHIEHHWVPRLSFKIDHEFFHVSRVAFGGGISNSVYLPARGMAEVSFAEGLKGFIVCPLDHEVSIGLEFGVQYHRQGYTDGNTSLLSAGGELSLGFHF